MTDERAVVAFEEVGRSAIPLVGGKGANLGEMLRAKIPVPSGFIVTSVAYSRFVEQSGLCPRIEAILSGLDGHDSDALQRASRQIEQMVVETAMPAVIAEQIGKHYRELGSPPVAVHSSATAEDLPEASFAGQQSTFLNVVGEDRVVAAVKECWASLFEARAIFHRVEDGFEHMKVKIAVAVQRMVQSDISGAVSAVEPTTMVMSVRRPRANRGAAPNRALEKARSRNPPYARDASARAGADRCSRLPCLLVFISHVDDDYPAAKIVARRVKTAGMKPWLFEDDISAGSEIVPSIQEALKQSDVFLAIISRAALISAWVNGEIADAIYMRATHGVPLVIPILVEDCILPPLLRGTSYVRLQQLPTGALDRRSLDEIVSAIRRWLASGGGVRHRSGHAHPR